MDKILKELQSLKKQLNQISVQTKEILDTDELSNYLNLSKSCIYKFLSQGEIPCYCPGGKKKYFKKSEIDEWIFKSKAESLDQLASVTDSYLSRIINPLSND